MLACNMGAILAGCKIGEINTLSLLHRVISISNIVIYDMGGTSGTLYAIYFTALTAGLTDAHIKSIEEAPALFPLLA
jgi:hypothetical protein